MAFNGIAVSSWDDVSRLIRTNLDHPALVIVERGGQRLDLKPVNTVITGVPDRYDPSKRLPLVSLASNQVIRERGGPIAVIGDMWQMTKQTVVALAYFPAKVFYTAYNLVTGQPRDIYGPMSIVRKSSGRGDRFDGPDRAAAKVASLFTVLGAVNLFVALFNSRAAAAIGRRARGGRVLRGGETGFSPSRPTRSRSCRHGEAAARRVRRRRNHPDLGCCVDLGRHFRSDPALLTFPFSWWVGCAAEVVVAGGCADDDLVWSGVEAAVDELTFQPGISRISCRGRMRRGHSRVVGRRRGAG